MEIHALEWKPEDASRHEKQRRDNIRRAVHEFLPPSDSFTRLPPQAPQPMPSRGQPNAGAGTSKEPGLPEANPVVTQSTVIQSARASFSPTASFERATEVTRTVPIPQKRTSRVSLSAVAAPKSTLVRQEEPLRPQSSSSTANIFFPRRARVTPPKNPSDEPITSTAPFEEPEEGKTLETTSSTRFVYVG